MGMLIICEVIDICIYEYVDSVWSVTILILVFMDMSIVCAV